MPLITLQTVVPDEPSVIDHLMVELREAGARALGCPPSNIWVQVVELRASRYLQGTAGSVHEQETLPPPVVILRAQEGRTQAERTALCHAITCAVAERLLVPRERVWVYYESMRPSDVWFEQKWSG